MDERLPVANLVAAPAMAPVHLVLDSTGLELFGQGEWDADKHGRARRRWLKLHVGVDADTGEIAAHLLTDGHADDAAQVSDLLRQPEGVVASVIADGAYDGDPVYQAAAAGNPVGGRTWSSHHAPRRCRARPTLTNT